MEDLTILRALPGAELVLPGIADLERGEWTTVPALLVAIGAPRLRDIGVDLPETPADPQDRLYRHLYAAYGDDAHGRYNALVRRLVSFEHALEAMRERERAPA